MKMLIRNFSLFACNDASGLLKILIRYFKMYADFVVSGTLCNREWITHTYIIMGLENLNKGIKDLKGSRRRTHGCARDPQRQTCLEAYWWFARNELASVLKNIPKNRQDSANGWIKSEISQCLCMKYKGKSLDILSKY